jgi:hypothetical protein
MNAYRRPLPLRTPQVPHTPRGGYTLLEMVVALPLLTLLVIGSTAALSIVGKASDNGADLSKSAMRTPAALEQMQSELECATTIVSRSATQITVTIPDRTGDSAADTVAYTWSGSAGAPLRRQFNGGTAETLLETVQAFGLTYNTVTAGPTTTATSIDVRLVAPTAAGAEIVYRMRMLNEPVVP